jgi:alcohol dehydrogenase
LESEVTVTTSQKNEELCKKLGAKNVIDYKTKNFVEELKNYDFAYDTTGEYENTFKILKPKSILSFK